MVWLSLLFWDTGPVGNSPCWVADVAVYVYWVCLCVFMAVCVDGDWIDAILIRE